MSDSCNCMVKKLHSYQTKPTDKDGGLEASRSYKDLVKSSPAWRMTGGGKGGKGKIREPAVKEENEWGGEGER